MKRLVELLPDVAPAWADRPVTALVTDSRRVVPGAAFLAVKGLQQDARAHIPAAIAAGAAVVLADADAQWPADTCIDGVPVLVLPELALRLGALADRFHDAPSSRLQVLAVTGTNGKTSVANLLAGACERLQQPAGVIGTLGNGRPGQLQSSLFTTPDALQLQGLLAGFRDQGVRVVAMEASSHGLQQGRMAGTAIRTALFTNLTRDHLDYHGDMASYAAAKGRLFRWPGLRFAVINADDPQGDRYAATLDRGVTCWRYSLRADSDADICALSLRLSLQGLQMQVRTPQGVGELSSPLLGRFNASNLLAVLGGLLSLELPLPAVLAALAETPAVPGRMQCLRAPGRALAVIDYAHTPDALAQVLTTLRDHVQGRLWCVFGCGGGRDVGKRPEMGRIAAALADVVVVTSDNPREEDPQAVIDHVVSGMAEGRAERQVMADRAQAIAHALSAAGRDDLVLIAGKGHETYQEIQGVRYPFSDEVEVRKLYGGGA